MKKVSLSRFISLSFFFIIVASMSMGLSFVLFPVKKDNDAGALMMLSTSAEVEIGKTIDNDHEIIEKTNKESEKVNLYNKFKKKEEEKINEALSKNPNANKDKIVLAHIKIPTINQAATGYILGCEGVSLYMALKGLGYADNYSLDQFMKTMPKGSTPFEGYMGNPKIGHYGENYNKRTTIYPEPLAKWASNYAKSKNLTGASVDELKMELAKGHVVLVYVTSGWNKPIFKKYPWSIDSRGEVENNHCLTIVGYRANGDILVNDCHDGRKDGRQGEYWVSASKFAEIYNIRQYAISVY